MVCVSDETFILLFLIFSVTFPIIHFLDLSGHHIVERSDSVYTLFRRHGLESGLGHDSSSCCQLLLFISSSVNSNGHIGTFS